MSKWQTQEDGSVLGAASAKSLEWANGDRHKIACLGFVAFCRDRQLEPTWFASNYSTLTIAPDWLFEVLLDSSPDYTAFLVLPKQNTPWKAVVRILDRNPPIIHILGVSGTLEMTMRDPGPWPRFNLLRVVPDWLAAFPPHQTPWEGLPHAQSHERKRTHLHSAEDQPLRSRGDNARAA